MATILLESETTKKEQKSEKRREGNCARAQSKVDIGREERASRVAIMNRLWRFLREKRNREMLGWIGGGLVVLASGIWAVTIYLFPAQKAPEGKPTEVQARCGSVA